MSSLEQFAARAEAAERDIEKLVVELEALKNGTGGGGDKAENTEEVPKELIKLESENSASADGGPRSRVCARETLRSGPHRY